MSEITQPSWHEYMKQHGTEEYAAWEAAVKPYAERIAALTQQLADMTKERDAAIPLIEALKSDRRGLLGLVRACLEQGTPSGELHLLELANRVVEQRDSAQAATKEAQRLMSLSNLETTRMAALLKDAVEVLEKVRSYNADIAASKINYRPEDHIRAIDAFLARRDVVKLGGGK